MGRKRQGFYLSTSHYEVSFTIIRSRNPIFRSPPAGYKSDCQFQVFKTEWGRVKCPGQFDPGGIALISTIYRAGSNARVKRDPAVNYFTAGSKLNISRCPGPFFSAFFPLIFFAGSNARVKLTRPQSLSYQQVAKPGQMPGSN